MIDKIEADLKTALIARDQAKVLVLRGLKSSLKNEEIAKRRELNEDEIIQVLKREAKQREESALAYEQGNAPDRASAERAEKTIIEAYLPAALPEADIKTAIEACASELEISDISQMGRLVGAVMQRLGPRADGAVVARMVKEHLQA